MHLVVAAGLIGHVTLPSRVVLHRPLKRLGGGTAQQLATLLQQLRAISFDFHEYYSKNRPKLARTNHDFSVSGRARADLLPFAPRASSRPPSLQRRRKVRPYTFGSTPRLALQRNAGPTFRFLLTRLAGSRAVCGGGRRGWREHQWPRHTRQWP